VSDISTQGRKEKPEIRSQSQSGKAFDEAARRYDADAANNHMMLWLRRESLRHLFRAFNAGDNVLEIGCGTGDEAIALARRGVHMLATDASAEMIKVTRQKIRAAKLSARDIKTRVLPVERLVQLIDERGAGSFDGAYSSLGVLNCTPDLAVAAGSLALLVKPQGTLVISLLNKYCLWEILWYLAARKPRLAFRRRSGHTRGTALPGGPLMDVYYWPVREIEQAFAPWFEVRTRRAMPWALPPTYATGPLARWPLLFSLLRRIERNTARLWPFYKLGDHVHLVMVRR